MSTREETASTDKKQTGKIPNNCCTISDTTIQFGHALQFNAGKTIDTYHPHIESRIPYLFTKETK